MARSTLKHVNDEAWEGDAEHAPEAVDSLGSVGDGQALLVRDLGWSRTEALETHARLRPFAEDWEAPGMDAYDDL